MNASEKAGRNARNPRLAWAGYLFAFFNLAVFLLVLYLLKPIWFGIDGFIIAVTGVNVPWMRIIPLVTVAVMLLPVYAFVLLVRSDGGRGQMPGRTLFLVTSGVLAVWNGMLAMLLLQAGEVFLLPTLRYYLYEVSPWCGMAASLLLLTVLLIRVYRVVKQGAAGRPPFVPAAVFTVLAAVILFVYSFTVYAGRDRRAFPHDRPLSRPVDYVNPLNGTHGPYEYGATDPLVAVPFGMTHWTPMTQRIKLGKRAYRYYDGSIAGFLATHRPAVWMGDYGQVAVMPGTGTFRVRFGGRALGFRHRDETATPYYYRVPLKTGEGGTIIAEMTATERCGILRFTFPKCQASRIMVEASMHPGYPGYVKIDAVKRELAGYNCDRYSDTISPPLKSFRGYFVIKIGKAFAAHGTWKDDTVERGGRETLGNRIGAWAEFPTIEGETVEVRVGTSFISLEQARENLRRELDGRDFTRVMERSRALWSEKLDAIAIEGADDEHKSIFYTGMYRCLLFPREFSEYGRYYSAFDEKIHAGVSYNDYSLWDTFRAVHPLLILIAPERVPGMITSLLQMCDEGGWMPKWPNPGYTNIMIGTHADSVIADACIKGVRGFDTAGAYRAVYKNAMVPPDGDGTKRWADRDPWTSYEARGGLSWYKKLGYVPADRTAESVSRTIEFSYGDFCAGVLAGTLGKEVDRRLFMKRSENYRNLYNASTGFMAPRNADGSWNSNPAEGFTEGDRWTYLFGALHDPDGMIALMGGRAAFINKLDENFNSGHYVHENEPGHHYVYLYNYAGAPWKAQERARYYCETKYKNGPSGLPGDEDCGQMSAWFLFSAMGFYPVCPGKDEYALGSPLFKKTVIRLGGGRTFEITAPDASSENKYVQSVSLNGKKLERPFIRHGDIISGGRLVFVMGPRPLSE